MPRMNRSHAPPVFWTFVVLLGVPASIRAADAPAAPPASTRESFLKVIDRPRVELSPAEEPQPSTGADEAFTRLHFTFAADAKQRVPGLLFKQRTLTGRAPVVIVLHGTGGKKEGEIALLRRLADK